MKTRIRLRNGRASLVAFLVALMCAVAWAQRPELPTSSERIQKITDTIYVGMPTSGSDSNGWIFINDDDVLVVDDHWTPARGRTLLADIRKITPKPVKYVVNTHYHSDHSLGNQAFPDAQIVGHEYTRQMLLTDILSQRTHRYFTIESPSRGIDTLKQQIAAETDPQKKDQLEGRLAIQVMTLTTQQEEVKEARPIPPTVTFKDQMTIFRGNREFRLMFLGRAHSGGDIVVYLPQERLIATGDMFGNGPGYMGDAFMAEWPDALERLKQIDFDRVLPGHGPVIDGKGRIAPTQAYFRDLYAQAASFKKQGLSAAEAAKRIDLTKHKATFQNIQQVGADPMAVDRIYAVLDGDIMPK